MMTTRAWFRVHSFTGVITGLLLFVICWSGTFAVIGSEIDWLVTPELRVEAQDRPIAWQAIYDSVATAYPEATIWSIEAPLYSRSVAEVILDQSFVTVFVDPYTAEVQGAGSYFDVRHFLRMFHYTLFQGDFGFYLVCAFAITMLVSLGASLVFFKRWWRRFARLPRGHGKAFWSEFHKTAGLWSIWFLVVIAVTGVWYLVEWAQYEAGIGKISYAGTQAESSVRVVPRPADAENGTALALDTLLARVSEARPELDIRTIRFQNEDMLYVDGQGGHTLVRDRANQLYLDRSNGAILYNQNASDLSPYWRWSDTADPLHFGDFAGFWSKIGWFVFGLVLSGLILTGTWLHAHRRAREAGGQARHRWPGTGAALIVSIAILAASVPFGLDFARAYGPVVDGVRQFPEMASGALAFILGWIAVTLSIVAAWVFLLWRPEVVLGRTTTPDAAKGAGIF